ncbi:MAG: carbohydrate ABC transporter permease [Clostridia bacterium]|nr:carbohydrate ABC transporter permease [Clostridia bacterium]
MERISKRRSDFRHQLFLHLVLVVACLYVLTPLFYLVVNSFKDNYEVIISPFALPSAPTLENYKKAWTTGGLAASMLNTVLVVAVSTAALAVVSCMMSYGMAFMGLRTAPLWSAILMLVMQVPLHMYIVPLFVMWKRLGLVNNPLGIILIYSAVYVPFSVLFLNSQFASIPKEIIEAAEIDGCSYVGTLTRVVVPIMRPALVTLTLINAKWVWNEFTFSMTFLQEPAFQTVTARYLQFSARFVADYAVTGAGAVISVLPIVLVYLLLQRRFIEGMTSGSVKG